MTHTPPSVPPLGVTAVMLPELDLPEQLALCRSLGVTHYTLRPRLIPASQHGQPFSNWGNHKFDLTPERLLREASEINRQITDAGLTPFGTVPTIDTNTPADQLTLHFEGAEAVGAGRVRVAPMPYPDGAFNYPDFLARVIDQYARAVAMASPFGIKIVIETHARSLAASPALASKICEHFDPADLGVIFDIANFNIEGGINPHVAVAILGPYIDHCHVGGARRIDTTPDSLGFRQSRHEFCSISEADLHIPDWIHALVAAGHRCPLIIEDYSPDTTGVDRLTRSAMELKRILSSPLLCSTSALR